MIDLNLKISYGYCQRPCTYCYYYHIGNDGNGLFIDSNWVDKFIQLNKKDSSHYRISIIPFGEPIIHPEFFSIIEKLHNNGFYLFHLSTNLAKELTDEEISKLSYFEQIGINYTIYNIKKELVDVTDRNIEKLKIIKDKTNINICYVEHPRDNFVNKFHEFEFIKSPLIIFTKEYINKFYQMDYNKYYNNIGINDNDNNVIYSSDINPETCGPNINIQSSGKIYSCGLAMVDNEEMILGDSTEISIKDLLFSEKFIQSVYYTCNKKYKLCDNCITCGNYEDGEKILQYIREWEKNDKI